MLFVLETGTISNIICAIWKRVTTKRFKYHTPLMFTIDSHSQNTHKIRHKLCLAIQPDLSPPCMTLTLTTSVNRPLKCTDGVEALMMMSILSQGKLSIYLEVKITTKTFNASLRADHLWSKLTTQLSLKRVGI